MATLEFPVFRFRCGLLPDVEASQSIGHGARSRAREIADPGNTQCFFAAGGPSSLTTNPDVKEWVSIKS
jgi:hypothetical protein